jgi:hypothetical protein
VCVCVCCDATAAAAATVRRFITRTPHIAHCLQRAHAALLPALEARIEAAAAAAVEAVTGPDAGWYEVVAGSGGYTCMHAGREEGQV